MLRVDWIPSRPIIMSGAGGVGVLVLLMFFSIALGGALLAIGIVAFSSGRRLTGISAFAALFLLAAHWGDFAFSVWLNRPRSFHVAFDFRPKPPVSGTPNASGTDYLYSLSGKLDLDIGLPDGKRIVGESREISIIARPNGGRKLVLLYHPRNTDSARDYWADGRKVLRVPGSAEYHVDRGNYSAMVQVYPNSQDVGFRLEIEMPSPNESAKLPETSRN